MIYSALQKVMGEIYAEDLEKPLSAMVILGDFCFLAGLPNKELVSFKPEVCRQDFIIMVPQDDNWAALIEECYGERAKKVTRYAIKKEPQSFDREKLQQAVSSLPPEYEIKLIDETIYKECLSNNWSKDLVSQFESYESYKKLGLGAVILTKGTIVCGASSYSRYLEGIEIEIDTKEEYRRKGLAYACGAKLILECLSRNLYPSWDAQNKGSVALAEKLGYNFDYEYTAYEIWEY